MKTIGEHSAVSWEMGRAMERWHRTYLGKTTPRGGHPSHLAAALCGYLATMATGELEVKLSGGKRADYLTGQLAPLLGSIRQAVEMAAAEGLCVLHPVVVGGDIRIERVPAHRFFPETFGPDGRVERGYFADFRTVGRDEVVRLESFCWKDGVLTLENHAYRRRGNKLEKEIPLDSLECWKDLEKSLEVENIAGPLFGVIQMPFTGTVDPRSPLPVSLFAGAEESFQEFDRLYGELLYELHSGKRKRILERQALPGLGGKRIPGALGYQDLTADTYLVLDPMEQVKPFDDYSPVMRTEEYLAGVKAMLHLIENQCHLSPGALSLDTASGQFTATEVISRDKATYNTCRAVQEQGIRQGLVDLIAAMDALCDLYDLCPAGPVNVSIAFGDSVFEDTQQEFNRRLQLVEKGCLKPEKLLEWYFQVDGDTAREFLPKSS